MSYIYVKDRSGIEHKIDADKDLTLMEIIRDKDLDIEAACGGCCACATCHIYVQEDWYNKLPKMDDDEEFMSDHTILQIYKWTFLVIIKVIITYILIITNNVPDHHRNKIWFFWVMSYLIIIFSSVIRDMMAEEEDDEKKGE